MKKVVSIVFNNFVNDSRVLKESKSLQNAGYEVQVVALHEQGLLEMEIVQGIPVHRIRLATRSWSKHSLVQIIKYLEFALKVLIHHRRTDIIHCNDLNPIPISILLKCFTWGRAKIVYDAHEFETEVTGLSGMRKRIAIIMEKTLIRFVDRVMTVSEGIAGEYVNRYKIVKPALVMNCPSYIDQPKQDKFRQAFQISASVTLFLYQGGLYRGRGLEQIIEAFRILGRTRKDVALVIMGFGDLHEMVLNAAQEQEWIYYHEAVSPEVLLDYTASADIGISVSENSCLSHYYSAPNKFFEYAMAGLPILVSNLYELKKMVEAYDCGLVVADNQVSSLIAAIEQILCMDLARMSVNSRRLAKTYCWQEQEKALLHTYKELYI